MCVRFKDYSIIAGSKIVHDYDYLKIKLDDQVMNIIRGNMYLKILISVRKKNILIKLLSFTNFPSRNYILLCGPCIIIIMSCHDNSMGNKLFI